MSWCKRQARFAKVAVTTGSAGLRKADKPWRIARRQENPRGEQMEWIGQTAPGVSR